MNPLLAKLQPYPFEKLTALKAAATVTSNAPHIALSIGEPKHASPQFVLDAIAANLPKLSVYPTTKGIPELRNAIRDWAIKRFDLQNLNAETEILPVNGTREALFAFAQCVVDASAAKPLVVSPNPFYQIYEGAAYLAGAEPYYLPCLAENNFIPDYAAVPAEVWQRTQLLFICTPGNPSGSVMGIEQMQQLIKLADQYDFIIASDECYSEIYIDGKPAPAGLLQACAAMGRHDYKRCVVFHSLSKRSNLPGLRSGFVAGDAQIMQDFLLYRTYHGCAMPVQHQLASIAAWNDEAHVIENRRLYTEKFKQVIATLAPVMEISQSDASFYVWLKTPIDEELFAQRLFAEQQVTVLPGSYLSRTVDGFNPGKNRVRLALVADVAECAEAARRIRALVESL